MKETKNTIAAVVCVFLGGLIYVFFRQDIMALRYLSPQMLDAIKCSVNLNGNRLGYYFLFCSPDALWYLALLLLQLQYLRKSVMSQVLVWVTIMIPFLLEMLQYYGVCRGTFDWCDILSYLIILILILWIQKPKLSCF